MTGKLRRSRRIGAGVWALVLSVASAWAGTGLASASTVESVHIDHVAVSRDGTHRVWASVLDAEGNPVPALDAGKFRITMDRNPTSEPDISVKSFDNRYPSVDITLIMDPTIASDILRGNGSELMGRVLGELRPGDRLQLVGSGESLPRVTVRSTNDWQNSQDRLRRIGAPAAPRVFEAIFQEVKRARRSRRGDIIVVVTQGVDRGSRHGAAEVLALLRSFTRPAPISVFLWEGAEESRDGTRLNRLTLQSGGTYRRVPSAESLQEALPRAIQRARGAYLLTYRAEGWDREADRHHLRIAIGRNEGERIAEMDLVTDDVAVSPLSWKVWAGLGGIVLLAGGAAYGLRPRSFARLVVATGPERGCRFEIFGAPVSIGAAVGNDILLPDPHVSRNHAVLERHGRSMELVDSNSENGTFVNRDRVGPGSRRPLSSGDTITLGGTVSLTYYGPGAARRRA
jgi:FHA domain